ncbi:MAG: transcription antitermination protein NusB [Candidatus Levyibacteriota bacterium]
MKTPFDPRHKKRQKLIEELFRIEFHKQKVSKNAENITSNLNLIDRQIEKSAPEFPVKKINKIDLAILRLAVFELLIEKKEPPKVIVDEAIELAKEYGQDTSSSFINGVLGNILNYEKK